MKMYGASFSTIMMRYYLMMGIVIVSFFLSLPLLAILSLPVFLSTILGVSFRKKESPVQYTRGTKSTSIQMSEMQKVA